MLGAVSLIFCPLQFLLVVFFGKADPRRLELSHLGDSLIFLLLDFVRFLPILLNINLLQFLHEVLMVLMPPPLLLRIVAFLLQKLFLRSLLLLDNRLPQIRSLGFEFQERLMSFLPNLPKTMVTLFLCS